MRGDWVRRTIRYIEERRCANGGFCFYRLDEPNGSDTYFAIATLHLLGKKIQDPSTVRFLQDSQAPDGSFHNLYQAYYTLKGLQIMETPPRFDSRPYLRKQLNHFLVENALPETALKRLDHLTKLCIDSGIEIKNSQRRGISAFILSLKEGHGGFGKPVPTLLASALAAVCLRRLNSDVDLSDLFPFVASCENPTHGFLNVPHMAPSFLEHIHAGLTLSETLNRPPRFPYVCRSFIQRCQDPNGGFARTSHGLPTLADTFLAVHALTMLDTMDDTSTLSP